MQCWFLTTDILKNKRQKSFFKSRLFSGEVKMVVTIQPLIGKIKCINATDSQI